MDAECEQENPVRSGKRFKESVQNLEKDAALFSASIVGLVAFGICVVGLGVAKFVMGILYLHDCELQPLLPVYLIVEFCMAVILFIVIVVFTFKSSKDDKSTPPPPPTTTTTTQEFSIISAIICLVSVLAFLFLFIWLIVGTVWVVTLREEINAPGHCRTTTTTTEAFTTSSWNPTNNINTQTPFSVRSNRSSFPSITHPNEINTTSTPITGCLSCDETFVDFTFGVVLFQWVIVGAIFATVIGALLYFGLLLCICKAING